MVKINEIGFSLIMLSLGFVDKLYTLINHMTLIN